MENNKILLGHRIVNGKDTGGIFEPDSWCLPGGKQEYDETIFECTTREVKEETNLKVWNLEVFSAIDDIQPDKQDEWKWFSLDNLPERIYSPSKKFIDAYIVKNQKGDKEL